MLLTTYNGYSYSNNYVDFSIKKSIFKELRQKDYKNFSFKILDDRIAGKLKVNTDYAIDNMLLDDSDLKFHVLDQKDQNYQRYNNQKPDSLFQFTVLPYLQDLSDSSFSVMWETSLPVIGHILIGKAEFHKLKPKMKTAAKENKLNKLHYLTVNGLEKENLYFYQVVNIDENGDTLKGPVTQIIIPDYDKSEVSFTVIGDIQGGIITWENISKLMIEKRPQFIIHVGDLVRNGPNDYEWIDEFFKPAHLLLSQVPLYPAIGNHEQNASNFYRYYNLPENNAFYTIKKGPVKFIFADTNKDILPGSKHYKWLELQLAQSKEPWIIVVHHHPIFISANDAYRSSLMATAHKGDPNIIHLKSLYEMYNVDLVLNGHVHDYERSWPIYKNHINNNNGVVHITTGGGGGSLSDFGLTFKNWFTSEKMVIQHFLNIQVNNNELFMKMIDDKGNVLDTWNKTKNIEHIKLNSPIIKSSQKYFIDNISINIENPNQCGNTTYRIDDGEFLTFSDNLKTIEFNKTTTVTALITGINRHSNEVVKTFVKLPIMNNQKNGLKKVKADYFEGYFDLLPDFNKLIPKRSFSLDTLSLKNIKPRVSDHFAVCFKGSIEIPETNVYRFFLESFDGSRLIIDDKLLIDNDGVHYEIFKEGYAALEKGIHNIEVQYFDFERRETLNIKIGKQNEEMQDINEFIIK